MRALLVVAALASPAYADVDAGASIGAGAQGTSTYSAVELRLDVAWTHARLGLGVRGVWDDSEFRASDWSAPERAVTIVRAFEASGQVGETTLGIAAGALAPAQLGRIADGYRVALDDRWHTGVRTALHAPEVDAGLEIDDVLDPALVGGSVRWQMAAPWGMHAAIAVDPGTVGVVEVGAHRLVEGTGARVELGGSVAAELMLGAGAVAYGDAQIERAGITWSVRGDVRAGTGAAGSLFGPLYRVERATLLERAKMDELGGFGAGVTAAARSSAGWLELGVRERPGLGALVVGSGGAPMGKRVQAAAWAAVARDAAAGAGELRVAWARRMYSALQAARLYRDDLAVWSLTASFGAMIE